jgi:hypothetical protein
MKKLLLLASAVAISGAAFAQNTVQTLLPEFNSTRVPVTTREPVQPVDKIAKNGDTLIKTNALGTDNLAIYTANLSGVNDTGYAFGTNVYGDKGFAERFDIKSPDSSVLPLGAAIFFSGSASATSTKSVRVAVWSQGATTRVGTRNLYYTGMPNTILNSVNVPLTTLRKANGRIDSTRLFRFANAGTTYVADSFFVGFDMAYTWATLAGDSVGVYTTQDGQRHQPGFVVRGADTIVNVQNATQAASGTWNDNLNGGRFRMYSHYIMYALFRVRITTGVEGITRNDLTVFGTYPNPATNSAKLKLSLKNASDVTMNIMDMSGRMVSSAAPVRLASGTHELPVETSTLASGTYYCLVRTSNGDAMGIEFVVTK